MNPKDKSKNMHSFYLRLFVFVIAVVSAVFGVKFSQSGFDHIDSFKQLERLIPTTLIGVLEGESQVSGWVQTTSEQNYLRSPKTNTPSVYFRYLVEREDRDSDGNTRWVTTTDYERSVDFVLDDYTHKARVNTQDETNQIRWALSKRYFKQEGKYRYSEWRIEPEDKLLIYAWANVKHDDASKIPEIHLTFPEVGAYLPIISSSSSDELRAGIGMDALFKIWGGVSLLSLAMAGFVYALQIHRILAFLSLLSFVTMMVLGSAGLISLANNVEGGSEYVAQQGKKAQLELSKQAEYSSSNSGWFEQRNHQIRMNQAKLEAVFKAQISKFPENIFASLNEVRITNNDQQLNEEERAEIQNSLIELKYTRIDGNAYWWVVLGVLGFIGFTYIGFRYAKLKRMIENIPTSQAKGVSFGLAEVKGEVETYFGESLSGPLNGVPCVWYRYLVEERRGTGKNARWITISDDTQFQRFYCADRSGKIAINPDKAEIITRHKKVKREGAWRYSQWVLKPKDTLYALGSADIDPISHDTLILEKPENNRYSDMFILSNYSEKDLMIKKATGAIFALACAFSGMFAAAIFLMGMNGQFSPTDYLFSASLAPSFLCFFMLVLHYNDLLFLGFRADRNWANIQVSLKKRADLLPQIEQVLRGYQVHESNLLESITRQRNLLSQQSTTTSVSDVAHYLEYEANFISALKLTAEAYPDLKAQLLSASLMRAMTDLENEIALMREGFNDAVMIYNTRIETFPDLLLARFFIFRKKELLSFY